MEGSVKEEEKETVGRRGKQERKVVKRKREETNVCVCTCAHNERKENSDHNNELESETEPCSPGSSTLLFFSR